MTSTLVVIPPQSYIGWKVSISLVHALALASTIYRLVHRFRIRRVWWDDYLVIFPLLLNVASCVLVWIRFNHRVVHHIGESRTSHILNSFWLSLMPYLLTVWSTRVVLALSLGRIFPERHPARRWSYFLVVFMVASLTGCALVLALSCHYPSSLMLLSEATHCATTKGGYRISTIVFVVDNVFGDVLLVISPLVIFRRLKLPFMERRLLLVVFCGSSLMLIPVFAVAVIFLNLNRVIPGVDYILILVGLGNIEAGLSLFVSNLTVVSTCLYQAFRRLRNEETPTQQEIVPETSHPLSCSCDMFSNQSSIPQRLTLTEISTFSSSPASRREGVSHPSSSF